MVTMIEYFLSRDIGPSPNGKALDSDSSIFKVRILVAQLLRLEIYLKSFLFHKPLHIMILTVGSPLHST